MRRGLLAVLLALLTAIPLTAQERLPWFAGVGVGPLRQDRGGNDLMDLDGNFYQLHGGWQWGRHLGVRLDLMRASVGRNDRIISAPCPDPPANCAAPFLGPTRVNGLTTGLEASWIDRRFLLLASLAPAVYWLTDRPPDTRGTAAGIRLGMGGGYQLATHLWATLDLQYHRLFTDGSGPRWLVPASIGLELR